MAFLEIGDFCSLDEYQMHRPRRISDAQFEVGEIYTYMMRLADNRYEAAKDAVLVEHIERRSGVLVVRFAFLDEDLQIDSVIEEKLQDGLIEPGGEAIFIDYDTETEFDVIEAYVRDYYSDGPGQFLLTAINLEQLAPL